MPYSHTKNPNKILFLDRDGIINIDYGYVYKAKDFTFREGIFELLQLFIKNEYTLYIITNQSGIGRDYYTEDDFQTLTKWMLNIFERKNIHIKKVFYCPHAPEKKCSCRKPATGMIDTLLKEHPIDLKHSWMIGDKQSDIDLAHNAHIAHTIAIGTDTIENSEYSFDDILECKAFFEENQDTIL